MAEAKGNGIDRAAPFPPVLEAELRQIDARRQRFGMADQAEPAVSDGVPSNVPGKDDALERAERQARERRLVGLTFSGGGIRSATFNLGVLQGLADMKLLKFIDYLSTVSGGGYIGSWLAAWIHRQPGGVSAVEGQLKSNQSGLAGARLIGKDAPEGENAAGAAAPKGEPTPIQHLRRYSNYLAPRTGFLSADSWVLAATYVRNFLLGQLVILPAVVAVLLVSRLVMLFYHPHNLWKRLPTDCFVGMAILSAAVWLIAFVFIQRSALQVRTRAPDGVAGGKLSSEGKMHPQGMMGATLLLLLSAILFCWFAPHWLPIGREPLPEDPLTTDWCLVWHRLAVFMAIGAALAAAGYLVAIFSLPRASRPSPGMGTVLVGAATVSGLLGGMLLYATYCLLNGFYASNGIEARDYIQARATAHLTAFGPPIVLAAMVLGFSASVGVLKHRISEDRREWWASLCGRLLVAGVLWMAVNLVALYGTSLVLWAGPWVRLALGSGWLFTVAAGIFAGRSQRTGTLQPHNSFLDRLARLAPLVFVAGLLVAVSLLIHVTLDNEPEWENASDAVWVRRTDPKRPSTQITESSVRIGKEAHSGERREVVERAEVIDDGDIIQQMYWVSMLNTEDCYVPFVKYRLSRWSMARLKCNGVPVEVLDRMPATIQGDSEDAGLDREQFLAALDGRFPLLPYEQRAKIIQYSKHVYSMKFYRPLLCWKLSLWLLACVVLGVLAAWRVDVNLFSMHSLYGNRLVRAYLGASRGRRSPDPITGLDPDDDLRLANLRTDRPAGYDGPYLIVNAALNLVQGGRLDWQDRKAESFVFTPLFCGSEDTGYRVTALDGPEKPEGYAGNILLGTAVTVSGAAASPNMGYHSSPAVTALLTVFNARLGAWLGNPASRDKRWMTAGPHFGFVHLFRELFGITHLHGGYVYLSDGGHFENLGAYELVRRRCQYVIVCDSGQDPDHAFEDLGNLIRKCRTDFGIRIDIDLDLLRRQAGSGRSRWHCAIGKIRYDDVDPRAGPGTLVYLKPSLTGDEPADVLHYSESHPDFPHESTGDQFFSEQQFESYRALGRHIAEAVFGQSVTEMEEANAPNASGSWHAPTSEAPAPPPSETGGQRHRRRCREVFSSLVRHWFAMPPEYQTAFLQSTAGYVSIQAALRANPRLALLNLDVYPELGVAKARQDPGAKETDEERAARRCAEMSLLTQLFQVMESAWMSLKLDIHYAHPLNRGWMGIFFRWTSSAKVRDYWPVLRGEFGRGFVSFCERQMRMGVVQGTAIRFETTDAPEVLRREFRDQWPGLLELEKLVAGAAVVQKRRLSWLVYSTDTASVMPAASNDPADPLVPCGIILLSEIAEAPAGREPIYDLFVWMRGAYRNSGLGRPALRMVLDEVRKLCPGRFRLRARLPVADLPGPGGKLQRGMWLTFFHHFEFVRVEPVQGPKEDAETAEEREVLLERVFPAAP